MAGYMTKLSSYVYEGEHKYDSTATAGIEDAVILERTVNATTGEIEMKAAGSTAAKFTVKEIGDIYEGTTALRLYVDVLDATKTLYFVEQNDYLDDSVLYDTTKRTVAPAKYVRCHPLYAGEEFWSNQITNIDTATFTVGQALTGVTAGIIG